MTNKVSLNDFEEMVKLEEKYGPKDGIFVGTARIMSKQGIEEDERIFNRIVREQEENDAYSHRIC